VASETSKVRAVLGDAELLFRQGLRQLLESHGVDVIADTGQAHRLVRLATELEPDVVVVGSAPDGIDGVEAVHELRRVGVGAPVLMLIASEAEADVIEGILAGAGGYVLKDIAADHLVAAVAALVRGESYIGPRLGGVLVERIRREHHTHPAARSGEDRLTGREVEVLRLLARGLENHENAEQLFLSDATVKRHVSVILDKLELQNRTQAAVYAAKRGLD
jgi:two-component system NarL family response regulator